jgi:hypothetical protein
MTTQTYTVTLTQDQYDNLEGVFLEAAMHNLGWAPDTSFDEIVMDNGTAALDAIAKAANAGLVAHGFGAIGGALDRGDVASYFWDAFEEMHEWEHNN